jgi:DNA modification methylase
MSSKTTPLAIEYVAPGDLRPDPVNPRSIAEHQLGALTASLEQYGCVQPILARREDWTIIAGHQRVRASIRNGDATVPVIFLELPADKARELGLRLNAISGTWDDTLLGRLLADMAAADPTSLSLTGFADEEIARLLATFNARERRTQPESFDTVEALAQAGVARRTKAGDLWRLGDHQLAVGDATDSAVIERLLGDQRPAMTFTDPPYNVSLGDHGGQQRGSRKRRIANDSLDPIAWETFVRAWARTLLANVDGALYICMSSKEMPLVSRVLAEEGGHWSDTLIWAKDRFVLGRADYQRSYEPIWYGWREGASHHWCGDRDQGDVWEIARPSDAPLHPTMKPLPLMERAIANSSRPGDLVFDPFGGAGSTLIACERTGRRCAMVELDPRYADVVLARWEHFTGSIATRDGAPTPVAKSDADA